MEQAYLFDKSGFLYPIQMQRQGTTSMVIPCLCSFLLTVLSSASAGTCRGAAPPSCCARPFCRLKAPLGLSLLHFVSQTRIYPRECDCMKKINIIINIFIAVFIGVFIGHGVYTVWDFKTHPELYVVQSAPWYTSILIYGVLTIILLLICIVIKVIINHKSKQK